MATGCFISTGRSLPDAIERVRLAESLGYEAVYVTHIAGRESLTVLTAYALATERIRIGTGVVPIYTRTPATMAQTAATIDELSGGRLNLGLGVSHRPVVEGWHGQTIDKPVAEMREYVSIVRAILRGEAPPRGEKWRRASTLARPRPASRPADLHRRALARRCCASRARSPTASILWLCNPRYIADVVVPEVPRGARAGGPGPRRLRRRGRRARRRDRRPGDARGRRCARTCSPTSACPSTGR